MFTNKFFRNVQGQTIFMVTHNSENAALAHRIINLRDGRVVESAVDLLSDIRA